MIRREFLQITGATAGLVVMGLPVMAELLPPVTGPVIVDYVKKIIRKNPYHDYGDGITVNAIYNAIADEGDKRENLMEDYVVYAVTHDYIVLADGWDITDKLATHIHSGSIRTDTGVWMGVVVLGHAFTDMEDPGRTNENMWVVASQHRTKKVRHTEVVSRLPIVFFENGHFEYELKTLCRTGSFSAKDIGIMHTDQVRGPAHMPLPVFKSRMYQKMFS